MDVLNVMCVAAALSVSAESMDGTTGEADTALQSDRMTPEVLWAMGEELVWAEDNNTHQQYFRTHAWSASTTAPLSRREPLGAETTERRAVATHILTLARQVAEMMTIAIPY